jgi:hypothetical protein
MFATASLLSIIFIAVFMCDCFGKTRGTLTQSKFNIEYIQTTTKMPSECNTNITCNACRRYANITKNIRRVIIDPITTIPVKMVPVQQPFQPNTHTEPIAENPKHVPEKQIRSLRNGYYSQPILKTYLRGFSPAQNLVLHNPHDRYCYNVMQSIKYIIGI